MPSSYPTQMTDEDDGIAEVSVLIFIQASIKVRSS